MREPGWDDDHVLSDLGQRLWALNWDIFHVLPPHRQPSYVAGDLDTALANLPSPAVWRHRLATDPALRLDAAQTSIAYWALTGCEHNLDASLNLDRVRYVRPTAGVEIAVLVGAAGSGKSRVCQRIIAEFGARGMFVCPTAISNLAATAFEHGGTLHNLFNLGVETDASGNTVVQLEPDGGTVTADRDAMLWDARCGAIIIDEGFASVCSVIESIVEFCTRRDYRLRILINGAPDQLPPVVPYGSPDEIVAVSLLSSWVWRNAEARFLLRTQYRSAADRPWAAFLQALATGSAPGVAGHAFTDADAHATAVAAPLIANVFVHRPVRTYGTEVAMAALASLFGTDRDGRLQLAFNSDRAARHILCATNTQCHFWNDLITQMKARDGAHVHEYVGANTALLRGGDDMTSDMAMEALRDEADMFDYADHSVPLSTVTLSLGDLVMLPKTLDKEAGLVKNKLLRITALEWCRVHVVDEKSRRTHVLCRQEFIFSLVRHLNGIEIHRTQLPTQLAWAITVNKSQGKTIERALLDLRRAYWQHGSGHVAPSRVPLARDCLAYVEAATASWSAAGLPVPVIRNVVYPGLVVRHV